MLAILKRSESDLRQAIAISPHEINDRDNAGWTALHLSARWLTGVLILVEAGADVNCIGTINGKSLLDIAIERKSIKLLRILDEADCSFVKKSDSHQWYYLGKIESHGRRTSSQREYRQEWTTYYGTISSHYKYNEMTTAKTMMAELLVGFIANRRQRLYDLAVEKVPYSVLTYLLPKTDEPYLMDEKGSRLALELTSRGITVPPPLNPGEKEETGYHAARGQPKIAEILWKAGFRDVNGRDLCSMTPLMCCPLETLLRFIGWCFGKGFKLNLDAKQDRAWYREDANKLNEFRPGQPLDTETIYRKIYALGNNEEDRWEYGRSFVEMLVSSETDRQIAQRIFSAIATDGCKCACSISGCSTRAFLFKGFNDRRGRPKSSYLTDHDMGIFYCELKRLCIGNSPDAAEYLRLITFERLELTHTCCRLHWSKHQKKSHVCIGNKQRRMVNFRRPMPLSEIEDIRDEESADLKKLAELLDEFQAKVVELDIPIPDFVSQYWAPRMQQVLQEDEGSLDMKALREIGVKIYPSEKPGDL